MWLFIHATTGGMSVAMSSSTFSGGQLSQIFNAMDDIICQDVFLSWIMDTNKQYLHIIGLSDKMTSPLMMFWSNLKLEENCHHCSVTHWGRWHIYSSVTYAITASYNGLSPVLHQAIILTNVDKLEIEISGTNFLDILIKIKIFSYKEMSLKISPVNGSHFVRVCLLKECWSSHLEISWIAQSRSSIIVFRLIWETVSTNIFNWIWN